MDEVSECHLRATHIVYALDMVGKEKLHGVSCWDFVCKNVIILDICRVYWKDTILDHWKEEQTPKEREHRRKAYASRKGIQNA